MGREDEIQFKKERLEKYERFCCQTYVPVYSQIWWMDAVCGPENWDVWLYEEGGSVRAAMPYYFERRGTYLYITKAPLTQNNGIIIDYPPKMKISQKAVMEERIVNAACRYIEELHVDVYEQQFQTTFTNWMPFFWNRYEAITRYTYTFSKEVLSNMASLWDNMDKTKRNAVNKGMRECTIREGLDPKAFYSEVQKVYAKQGLTVPFSYELWERLYSAAVRHQAGKIVCAYTKTGELAACKFYVWDECRMYQLIGGGAAELQCHEGHAAIIWHTIKECSEIGLIYDFEGSVIKRVATATRLFGAEPVPYFRIRKVFRPDIIMEEARMKAGLCND